MTPSRKVTAAGLGGALATVVIGVAIWLGAPDPPAGLEAAIATLAAFGAGYFTNDPSTGSPED